MLRDRRRAPVDLALPRLPMHALLQAIARAASQPPSGDARRLFHGRGGVHLGEEAWTLDLFPPVALLTSHRPATDTELATVGEALAAHWPALVPGRPLCWVHQCRDGLQVQTGLMAGALPDPHHAVEADARFELQLLRGRNHGFFLDMAEGRRWLREHLVTRPGARVLNLFAPKTPKPLRTLSQIQIKRQNSSQFILPRRIRIVSEVDSVSIIKSSRLSIANRSPTLRLFSMTMSVPSIDLAGRTCTLIYSQLALLQVRMKLWFLTALGSVWLVVACV